MHPFLSRNSNSCWGSGTAVTTQRTQLSEFQIRNSNAVSKWNIGNCSTDAHTRNTASPMWSGKPVRGRPGAAGTTDPEKLPKFSKASVGTMATVHNYYPPVRSNYGVEGKERGRKGRKRSCLFWVLVGLVRFLFFVWFGFFCFLFVLVVWFLFVFFFFLRRSHYVHWLVWSLLCRQDGPGSQSVKLCLLRAWVKPCTITRFGIKRKHTNGNIIS